VVSFLRGFSSQKIDPGAPRTVGVGHLGDGAAVTLRVEHQSLVARPHLE
jgi:hypothetical protein